MVKQLQPPDPQPGQPKTKQQFEQERMLDVLFLLDLMFVREEATVKQIVDCLYDIGSINLINQRVPSRHLKLCARWIARFSKPAFRFFFLRWFRRNCPQLIADWLYNQVKFEPQQITKAVEAVEVAEAAQIQPTPAVTELDLYRQEVRLLHSRVRLLTTLLIGVTVTLGSGLAWALWRSETQSAQQKDTVPVRLVEQLQPCSIPALQPCR
ncbi:MAG: hypothetical protein EDM05_64625 [Leptolyngbya sp. IPPAS B-1204]